MALFHWVGPPLQWNKNAFPLSSALTHIWNSECLWNQDDNSTHGQEMSFREWLYDWWITYSMQTEHSELWNIQVKSH